GFRCKLAFRTGGQLHITGPDDPVIPIAVAAIGIFDIERMVVHNPDALGAGPGRIAFIAVRSAEAALDQFDRPGRRIRRQLIAAAIIAYAHAHLQVDFAIVVGPAFQTPIVGLRIFLIAGIINDDVAAYAFIVIVPESIIQVAEYGAQRIFIQIAVGVALIVHKRAFFHIKPKVTTDNDVRRALDKRAQF